MPLTVQQEALLQRAKENLTRLSQALDTMQETVDAMEKDDLEGVTEQALRDGLEVINQGHIAQARIIDELAKAVREDEVDLKQKEEEWRLEDALEPSPESPPNNQ